MKLNWKTPAPQFKAEQYILEDEGLKKAIQVAVALHKPLLLTGKPGTGKTLLAYKLAALFSQEKNGLNFQSEPLIFYTKTTSTAKDLFYQYDALTHFQAANIERKTEDNLTDTAKYIRLEALGKAIACTYPAQLGDSPLAKQLTPGPASHVVLIDEIDKAPRDFPNDILHEIDKNEFKITELSADFIKIKHHLKLEEAKEGADARIFVVMTSNSEKNLPDAFLRRCVFYNIQFPGTTLLQKIVQAQLELKPTKQGETLLKELIKEFIELRTHINRKKPATAELVAWLRILALDGIFNKKPERKAKDYLASHLSLLVKTNEDYQAIKDLYPKEN